MSKPDLAAVPEEEEPEQLPPGPTFEVETTGEFAGHRVTYRKELTGREFLAFSGGGGREVIAAIGSLVAAHDYGGDIIDQPVSVLTHLIERWRDETRRLGLDPTSASK